MIRVWAWADCPKRYKVYGQGGDEDWVIVCSPEKTDTAADLAQRLAICDYKWVVGQDGEHIFVTTHA